MALLKIARMGHPVLQRPAQPVLDPCAPEIGRLIADMAETMVDADGVGLAAPQVHVPLRVVLFCVPAARADDPDAGEGSPSGPVALTALINPEIEPLGAEMEENWEACLSVPGLTGRVQRFRRVRYRATGRDGREIAGEASGFHARVVQHECDHLDGTLYLQRMTDLRTLAYVEEVQRALRHSGGAAS
jgi:peptide deformylase